jgi:hypothetical protein
MEKSKPREGIEAIERLAQELMVNALSHRKLLLETQTKNLPSKFVR